jgi:hypothetical protein
MSKVAMSLLVVLSINLFLFFGQVAMQDINPGTSNVIFNASTSFLNSRDAGGYVLNESVSDMLPEAGATVDYTKSNAFTDFFSSIRNFFSTVGSGFKYLFAMVNAVPNFLKSLDFLPGAFVFGLGALWQIYTVFLIASFMWGDR